MLFVLWFNHNRLVLNLHKCKALVLPNNNPAELTFSANSVLIQSVDHLELLQCNNLLHFDKHISKIAKKVCKQLSK